MNKSGKSLKKSDNKKTTFSSSFTFSGLFVVIMTSELTDGDQLLQTGPFQNWTSINEQHLTADGVVKYFPPNATHVQINQTLGTVDVTSNTDLYLPHPLRLNDGQSRMWFIFWDLSAIDASRNCSLTFIFPAAINTSLYKYPATKINGSEANLVVSRLGQTGGDPRTKIGYILWCTSNNEYFIASMGDPTTFGTIQAGAGAYSVAASAPSLAAGVWSLNVYAGENVTLTGVLTNAEGWVGTLGRQNSSAASGYWLVSQPGEIAQLRFFGSGAVAGNVTLAKNDTDSALTIAAAGTTGADTDHSVAVVAGDKITIHFSAPGGTPTVSTAFVFRPSAK